MLTGGIKGPKTIVVDCLTVISSDVLQLESIDCLKTEYTRQYRECDKRNLKHRCHVDGTCRFEL